MLVTYLRRGTSMNASKITAVDFWDDLTSGYARKRFFLAFVVLSVAAIALSWFAETVLSPGILRTILSAVGIELAAGFIIVLSFYLIYMVLIGPNAALRAVNVARPQDISDRMAQLPKGVRNYLFWGRSGSFFRVRPLQVMDTEARENKRAISIEVLLPDPNDQRLVTSYTAIRKALNEDAGDDPLLPNILATCISCAIIAANNNQLDVTIHLSSFLPAFRVDLSDQGALLTQDDPKKSALFFEPNSEFYDMFRSMAKNERDMSRRIHWDRKLFSGLKLEAESCTPTILGAFGITIDDMDKCVAQVGRLIAEQSHRYK